MLQMRLIAPNYTDKNMCACFLPCNFETSHYPLKTCKCTFELCVLDIVRLWTQHLILVFQYQCYDDYNMYCVRKSIRFTKRARL